MSERLPVVSAKVMTKARLRAGFTLIRQSGSHAIYGKGSRRAIVPIHVGDLKPGTFKTILEAAGVTVDDFRELL